jgi:prevent-host-death family protein
LSADCGNLRRRPNSEHFTGENALIAIDDIRSLTDFQRNAKTYAKRMSRSGRPMVLTVNGKPGFVVQDANSYQELLDKLEDLRDLESLRDAVDQGRRGECIPMEKVFEGLREKHGFASGTDA